MRAHKANKLTNAKSVCACERERARGEHKQPVIFVYKPYFTIAVCLPFFVCCCCCCPDSLLLLCPSRSCNSSFRIVRLYFPRSTRFSSSSIQFQNAPQLRNTYDSFCNSRSLFFTSSLAIFYERRFCSSRKFFARYAFFFFALKLIKICEFSLFSFRSIELLLVQS